MLKEANVPAPRFLLSVPGLIQRTPCTNYREHEKEKEKCQRRKYYVLGK